MRTVIAALILLPQVATGQDAESLRARIEQHYTAIHEGDNAAVASHHLEEMSIFPWNGHVLMESGWEASASRMGAEILFPGARLTMNHFSAQIYDDVGVALFYLDGSIGDEGGTWRVSAVWVWRNGRWVEAHHHESRLIS